MDFEAIRERLSQTGGPQYWRSLEELAQTEEFQKLVRRRFGVPLSPQWSDVSRRQFLGLMAASLGLAGLAGCKPEPPGQSIVPYVRQPEEVLPGKPLFFATAMSLGGQAMGLVVESHEGRPTKVEGNQFHPASLGATDVFSQADILALYDPERSTNVLYRGQPSTWDRFVAELRGAIARLAAERGPVGVRLRILTEAADSPTLTAQFRDLLRQYPAARWHQFSPLANDTIREGSRLAFGRYVNTIYRFDQADRVLSLDANFLAATPATLRYAHDFIARRKQGIQSGTGAPRMNRLYVIESQMSTTGAKADHRWPLRASRIEAVARAVASRLDDPQGRDPQGRFKGLAATVPPELPNAEAVVSAIAKDLSQHRGASIVIAGPEQPASVHALAHVMNHVLGNVGRTIVYTAPVDAIEDVPVGSLQELADDMERGEVDILMILGGNPVYSAPADLDFRQSLLGKYAERGQGVPLRIHLGLYQDETAFLCDWHIPQAHWLEMWSDARAFDGTACVIQPLIAPLYGGRSAHEMIAVLSSEAPQSSLEIVRATWRRFWEQRAAGPQASRDAGPASFEDYWRTALHQGVLEGTAFAPEETSPQEEWRKTLETPRTNEAPRTDEAGGERLELVFRADPSLYDGRFANNAWLQELPKPLSKITWGNAAIVSPATAEKFGLSKRAAGHGGEHGQALTDVIELDHRGRTLRVPIWIEPGHPDGSITIHLGHGRTRAGKVGNEIGVNAYLLRTSDSPWIADGLLIRPINEKYQLACTQFHHMMEGRSLIRSGTIDQYCEEPRSIVRQAERHRPDSPGQAHRESSEGQPAEEQLPSMYPEHDYPGYRWAMGIDLTACIGCNACVVACQSENNIPVVGKEQVLRGREMHWLRIDRYYQGDLSNPSGHFQPVPCMHCEKAPCELVCPTEATVHSDDGLNDMVYNRCVGTRYCSNNCPYKVRRFNYFQYSDYDTEPFKLLRNPDVTVRSRGVMEKCTYCVQRIRRAEIEAEKLGRRVKDGEMVTACQAVCPASAIVFGDWNDPDSEVRRWKESPLNYGLLAELNTQPRTTYLAEVRNPNPELT